MSVVLSSCVCFFLMSIAGVFSLFSTHLTDGVPLFGWCSAYTEPYRVCPLSGRMVRETMAEEDQGRTSEDDDGCTDHSYDRHVSDIQLYNTQVIQ